MSGLINLSYFTAAVLFILGLKQMSSPVTARRGIVWAGVGMVVATLAFLNPHMHGLQLPAHDHAVPLVLLLGTWPKVATDMPQMIALTAVWVVVPLPQLPQLSCFRAIGINKGTPAS